MTTENTTYQPRVLVVDDEKNILTSVGICLESAGMLPHLTTRPQDVAELLSAHEFDFAFVDLKMSPMDGMDVLREIRKRSPQTEVIMMTAHGTVDSAVTAVKNGAYDYLQKPFDFDELRLLADQVWQHHLLLQEVRDLREELKGRRSYGKIITRNRSVLEQLDVAAKVADSMMSVLIEGESGTGKELLAEFIHAKSARAERSLVKVNCAALPESLLESELFGHVKGAFTGAHKEREGRFALADGGTIFLDEIGELTPPIQAKLLRVLQDREFQRVGESTSRKVDVRILAATNQNIDEALKEGTFREDLYYRLAGVRIKLQPLRDRPDDIPLLVRHLLVPREGETQIEITAQAEKALRMHRWSGNVRELENVIERARLLAAEGPIDLDHLPEEVQHAQPGPLLSLEEMERSHIKRVLQVTSDFDEAAKVLGIDRKTLFNKRKKYGL